MTTARRPPCPTAPPSDRLGTIHSLSTLLLYPDGCAARSSDESGYRDPPPGPLQADGAPRGAVGVQGFAPRCPWLYGVASSSRRSLRPAVLSDRSTSNRSAATSSRLVALASSMKSEMRWASSSMAVDTLESSAAFMAAFCSSAPPTPTYDSTSP